MDKRVRERRRLVNRDRGRQRAGVMFVCVLALVAIALFLWLRSSSARPFSSCEMLGSWARLAAFS